MVDPRLAGALIRAPWQTKATFRRGCRASLLVALSLGCVLSCKGPEPVDEAPTGPAKRAAASPEVEAGFARWRQARRSWVDSDEGPLRVIDLVLVAEGEHSIGSGPAFDIPLPPAPDDPAGPIATLSAIRDEQRARWQLVLERHHEELLIDGRAAQRATLRSDLDPWPSRVQVGRRALQVLERTDLIGIQIRALGGTGARLLEIPVWPASEDGLRRARFRTAAPGSQVELDHAGGRRISYTVAGHVELQLHGEPQTLTVLGLPGRWPALLPIGDATNGSTSFEDGRYLALHPVSAQTPRGTDSTDSTDSGVVELSVDLNRLSNPPCAFTPHALCPRPPESNRLAVTLEYGERTPIWTEENGF